MTKYKYTQVTLDEHTCKTCGSTNYSLEYTSPEYCGHCGEDKGFLFTATITGTKRSIDKLLEN